MADCPTELAIRHLHRSGSIRAAGRRCRLDLVSEFHPAQDLVPALVPASTDPRSDREKDHREARHQAEHPV